MAHVRSARAPAALFVMPPGGAASGFTEHVGIGFLRATLRRAGIAAAQYLPSGAVRLADFADALRAARPRVVGFTVYESNLRACRALARVARQVLPEAVLLAGGPNATFSPEETLELVGVDACLRGAGEGTVVRLVEAVLGGQAPRARLGRLLAPIPNLLVREGAEVVRTAAASLASFQREHFRELDDLPSPYQAGLLTTAEAGLLTARGCNQHCTYCSFAELSGRKVAFHGVERVLEDLAAWRAHLLQAPRLPRSVAILDDAFTLAPERARAICEGIVSRGLQLPFQCETRVDRVDRALLRLMRRAGFTAVAFGLESAVPRVLRAIGKVQPPATASDPAYRRERAWLEEFREAARQARAAGLEVNVSVIGGLPGESAPDFERTLDFVASLGATGYAHNVLMAMPGTPLHRDLSRSGLTAGRDPDTGGWVTRHAYDVGAVPPRPGAQLRRDRIAEALLVADALCGRRRATVASPAGIWAVVVHGLPAEPALATWLGATLPVGGTVVVVSEGPADGATWRAWSRVLLEAGVAHGRLALLAPERSAGGEAVYLAFGVGPRHRFELTTAWRPGGRSVEADRAGRCRIRVWLAGDPRASPPGGGRRDATGCSQIADGCRWWTRGARCDGPGVLHVRRDHSVAPCWSGPRIGDAGDRLSDLVGRAARLAVAAGGCPIGPAPGSAAQCSAVGRHEVASLLSGRLAGLGPPAVRPLEGPQGAARRARRTGRGESRAD
jgi:radical SAM superfamily enzyme YgiQ (UPF0313 family)